MQADFSEMIARRALLLSPLGLWGLASLSHAQQPRSLSDPLRLGVDGALFDSGLAKALQQGFGLDTGIAVKLVPTPALTVLQALDRGEFDAVLTNAPAAEAQLETQGLAHDRKPVARGEFVLVGPAPQKKEKDPAAIVGLKNVAEALIQVRSAALAMPGAVTFMSAADGSGTHVVEQALWREARLAPAVPWYLAANAQSGLIDQARARGSYALVERGAWAVYGGAPLAILVQGDPRLAEEVHVMRAFRINHPAGKIFVAWISGQKGQRLVQKQRAYRPA